MNIKDLIVPSKETVAEYPGIPGFNVTIAYLTREELLAIRKRAVTNKVNRKTRQVEEEVDSDLFQEMYIKAVLKNWKGLNARGLAKLLPIDMPVDPEVEIEFSTDNAIMLMRNSPDFDSFVTEVLDDVQNFTKSK